MEIGAAILMGGKNSRMGGKVKDLLKIEKVTFLEKIQGVLEEYSNIYLSINKNFTAEDIKKYEQHKLSVVIDVYDNIGPMGGIYSSLKYCKEDYLFITACDMPFINKELINILNSKLREDVDILVFSKNGLFYPLGAIYSKRIIPTIEELIKNKDYKLAKLIEKSNYMELSLEENHLSSKVFKNINTPKQYEELLEYSG